MHAGEQIGESGALVDLEGLDRWSEWAPRTLVGCGELLLQHGVERRLQVLGMRMARAVVHTVLVDDVVGGVARLQDIEGTPHIALAQLEDRLLRCGLDMAPGSAWATHFSAAITLSMRRSTCAAPSGAKRKRVHRLCIAGMILFT